MKRVNKNIIIPIILLSISFNCVTVFADTQSPINNTNPVLSDKSEYWKEPYMGYMTDNEAEVNSSYYLFENLVVSYTFANGNWERFIEIQGNGRSASSFDFDPYIMKNLPKIGKEGECITSPPFYMYLGEGLATDKVLKKIGELENKINSNHEN